jgi:hypothetical protein
MEGMEYFYELYTGLPRGGPGDNKSTRKAFSYLKICHLNHLFLISAAAPDSSQLKWQEWSAEAGR